MEYWWDEDQWHTEEVKVLTWQYFDEDMDFDVSYLKWKESWYDEDIWSWAIIWHPIHIGDVLDWIEYNEDPLSESKCPKCNEVLSTETIWEYDRCKIEYYCWNDICWYELTEEEMNNAWCDNYEIIRYELSEKRKQKRKPLTLPWEPTEWREDLINFIDSLIKECKTT